MIIYLVSVGSPTHFICG